MWNSDSITASKLNDLRAAAEHAWGDDTRAENYAGHPSPCHGQCYVTSAWLVKKLGGHVGTKRGHFFWVSPDKRYIIDLTGDLYAYPPIHESRRTPDDDPHHHTWRAGPVMFKRSDHPLYKGLRVLPDYPNHQRSAAFARRADAVLRGTRVADQMGDAYAGDTPQMQENWDMGAPMPFLHDEPNYDPEAGNGEYQFVVANGQVHVSPHHTHDDMITHAGQHPQSEGPMAMGYVNVHQGHALWSVTTNMSMRSLHEMLSGYSDTVGWDFEGMVGADGAHLHDDFGPKMAMWYKYRPDGHLVLAKSPLPRSSRIQIIGKTAYVQKASGALEEWATDFGYRLAEYPGGGDMTDTMKNKENLDVFNRGDTDFQPERSNPDMDLGSNLKCGFCGRRFEDVAQLRLHERGHEPLDAEEIPDGHFPQMQDFDIPLGFGTNPNPNPGIIACMVLPSYRTAAQHPRFDLYAKLFGYDSDEGLRHYGAFHAGQLIGYATVRLNAEFGKSEPEVVMIDSLMPRSGVGSALLSLIQKHYGSFSTHTDSEAGAALLRRHGAANISGQFWRWAKGTEPKDMIEAGIPFIYDVDQDDVHLGYAGQQTRDVQHKDNGQFTIGQIVEGYYEPGGKIVFVGMTNVPVSFYHFAQLWYHRYPQMEISSMEAEDAQGKTYKLAAQNVGQYLRTLVASDQAVHNAQRALTQVGGQVYVVGGAIRDALQQREPKDIDLMVAGLPPEQVEHVLNALPGAVNLTGKRFGVYRYKVGGQEVEVALPRQDKYESSRRGEGVITVDHNLPVEKDLERRDFTANSMAVNLDNGNLIDPHGGARDLEANILRTTHPDSFREDPTRLVRALVAHSRFGLQPDERTRNEMATNGHLLSHESPDALNKILDKLFASGNPASAIRLARDTSVLPHLFPEVAENWDFDQNNPHHRHTLGDHLVNVLDNVARSSNDPDLRLAALYHDVGKPASQWTDPDTGMGHYYLGPGGQGANHEDVGARMVEDRMRALNYPTARISRVRGLVQNHMFPAFNTPKGARKFLSRVGPLADDLLTLRGADMTGKGQTPEEIAARTSVDTMGHLVDQARTQQAPTDIASLAINGDTLVNMGLQPGPQIGAILRSLVQDVINEPSLNTPEALTQRAQGYIDAQPS